MTPKEKAIELLYKYQDAGSILYVERSIKYALIAVDEILNNFGLVANGKMFYTEFRAVQYYQEVKQEIENYSEIFKKPETDDRTTD